MKRKDIEQIKACAARAGVSIKMIDHNGKHYRVRIRGNKAGVVFVSVSPSDIRAYQNVVTDMRRVTR